MKIIKYPENISKDIFLNSYAARLLECMKSGMKSSYDIVLTPEGDSSWYKYLLINLEKGVRYIIFEDENDIRGYLVWHNHDKDVHFYDLVIRPKYQCDGVTLRNLLEIFATDIKEKGFNNLVAYTNFKNDRMNKILLRYGFEVKQVKARGTMYIINLNKFLEKFTKKLR